jgi:WD40 repeat protein
LPGEFKRPGAAPTPHPVSFSRDGSRLAMGYFGIQIWDFDQRTLLFAVPLLWHAEAIQFTATDSDLIVACSYHGAFKISGRVPGKIEVFARGEYERMRVSDPRNFNIYDGPPIRRQAGTDPAETADFYCLAVYPDSKRFVAGGISVPPGQPTDKGAAPLVKVWEVATGRGILVIGDKEEPIARFCLSPDGRTLYSCGSKVLGWDATKSGPPVRIFEAPIRQGISIAVSPDGATLAVGGLDGTVAIWGTDSTARLATLIHGGGAVSGLAFSPASTRLVSAAGDKGVATVWDLKLMPPKQD